MKQFLVIFLIFCSSPLPLFAQAKKVVFVHLRGGLDALATVQPLHIRLSDKRPYLYREPGALLKLPRYAEGVHSSFPELHDAFNDAEASILHKVGAGTFSNSAEASYELVSRGVPNASVSEQRGWLQRLASSNNFSPYTAVDLSAGAAAFANGPYEPLSIYGSTNISYFERDDSRDLPFRLDSAQAILSDFTGESSALRSFKAAFNTFNDTSASVRAELSDHGLADTGNAVNQYPNNSFGYRFREAEFFLRRLPTRIAYFEVEGLNTYSDQEDRLEDRLEDLSEALATFRYRMKAANQWNETIVVIISDGGRSTAETGKDPEYEWSGSDYKGTNFGGAFDVYVLGGALRRGAEVIAPYGEADWRSHEHLPATLHIMDIYAEVIEALGFSAGSALTPYNRTVLGLFN